MSKFCMLQGQCCIHKEKREQIKNLSPEFTEKLKGTIHAYEKRNGQQKILEHN